MNKKPTSPVIKGLVIAALLIVFSVIISVLQYEQQSLLGLVPIVVMLVGIVWACTSYSKDMYGNVTFSNIFVHGFKASALVAGIMAIFVLLSLTLLFPETLDRAMEKAQEQMTKDKKMTETEIKNGMRMGRKMAAVIAPPATALMYLIGGAICSVIGAAISKKTSNPVPFDHIDQPIS